VARTGDTRARRVAAGARSRAGRGGAGPAGARGAPPPEGDRAPDRGPAALPLRPAVFFLRNLRGALVRGVSPVEALASAAASLPNEARSALGGALRRLEGDFPEDAWGFDEGFADAVYPLLELMYERWWRVQAVGVPNVPAHGRALLVANHAGALPWDATMIATAILREHPLPRFTRFLVLRWTFELPWLSVAIRKLGGVVASPYNAIRLLEEDELVAVFPEGARSMGKDWSDRYRLQRFGRGGFVEIALRTGAPIVPVAVVGSEEVYPKLADARALARLVGAPSLPVTPTFPALGPLGAVPLPSRWRIEFGEPIDTAELGPEAADDRRLVLELADRVREDIQERLLAGISARGSPFL
jgi:1-acyl-sn-glycerol-3-phosphate acyltransferase